MYRLCRILAATLAVLAATCSPAWSGYKEAVEASERGDLSTALREFRALANNGDRESQYWMGIYYFTEKYRKSGAQPDNRAAVKWFQKAAAQGHARAQFFLGSKYEDGQGVTQDVREGLRWFLAAAAQGLANAQYQVGGRYFLGGIGVPKNFK
jgi:hypothetical protein